MKEKCSVFNDPVQSLEDLRNIIGFPSELVTNKVIQRLDKHCNDFINQSPLLFVATSDSNGRCDVSPCGDTAGFIHILDTQKLIIPERPGNRRLDTLINILSNPNIGLIFIIPGLEEALRVNGQASVINDQDLLEHMAVNGRVPQLGIGVVVEEVYLHCAKAFKRAQLWDCNNWTPKESLPSIPRILADHVQMKNIQEEEIREMLQESYKNRLY